MDCKEAVDGTARRSTTRFVPYRAPVRVERDGQYLFVAGSTDQAGNDEHSALVIQLRIDSTAPVVTASTATGATPSGSYNGPVDIALQASDALSGVDHIEYSLDGGTIWTLYGGAPIQFDKAGSHRLLVTAYDKAGNRTADQSQVFVIR